MSRSGSDLFTDEQLGDLYKDFGRPQVASFLKLLKLDRVYRRAEGNLLYCSREDGSEETVIDFLGGYGSALLGHNPPELVALAADSLATRLPVQTQASVRGYTARLCKKLSDIAERSTGKTYVVTLVNSGAEAVEAAIKHALLDWNTRREELVFGLERAWSRATATGEDRAATEAIEARIREIRALQPVIFSLQGSFHGKTAASVAASFNPEYKKMYPRAIVETAFLDTAWDAARVGQAFTEWDGQAASHSFSRIAAILLEPIQCEGGVRELSAEFATALSGEARARAVPLVVDEIQTGLCRTGAMLAGDRLGLKPDYLLFGKSLGGGLVKIGAMLVETSRYVGDFGFLHTSTFAEDDPSSRIALAAVETIERRSDELEREASEFFSRTSAGLEAIQAKYPGVISEVRGRGFLIGVQFNFGDDTPVSSFFSAVNETGLASYVFSSYLLNRHSIRIGVTLSKPDTIRIEPPAAIEPAQTDRMLEAIEDLCKALHERRFLALTEHFWRVPLSAADLSVVSSRQKPRLRPAQPVHRVGFLSHVIDSDGLARMDSLFKPLPTAERERFHRKFGPMAKEFLYHEQLIEGANGRRIHLHCLGVMAASTFFEESLRRGDFEGYRQVRRLADRAVRDGMVHVGLGQYTSIVTENGLMMRDYMRNGLRVTTGNSLTAALAWEGLRKMLADRGIAMSDAHIGIVGPTGNICNVLSQLIADEARQMTLVYREPFATSPKFQRAVQSIVKNSRVDPSRLKPTSELTDLATCDAVLVGTNSAAPLILPEHLAKDALVLDISVPSGIHPSVWETRPDVTCIQGGFARMPLGQSIDTDWLPLPAGDTYACMAETICTGLTDYQGHFSLGHLSKGRVLESLKMAAEAGVTLGTLRRYLPGKGVARG